MEGSPGAETYLTVAEVAELLKLNQQTVRNWIDQGSLPALRVGRRVRIRRSDFERVLEAGSTVGGAQVGPSAIDFWTGKPVGVADLDPGAGGEAGAPPANDSAESPGNGARDGTPNGAPDGTPQIEPDGKTQIGEHP
jgi:excisionase family DNA binding protein